MQFKAIGFDYGNVMTASRTGYIESIASVLGLPVDKVRPVYFANNHLINIEGVSIENFAKIITEQLGVPEKAAVLIKNFKKHAEPEIDSAMLALVDTLRSKNYKVGLLSNNRKEAGDHMRAIGLDKHFDTMIISAEVGVQKPSKQIFDLFIKKMGVSANELIFIDDSHESLKLSGEIGFHPILFKNYGLLVEQLTFLEILKK